MKILSLALALLLNSIFSHAFELKQIVGVWGAASITSLGVYTRYLEIRPNGEGYFEWQGFNSALKFDFSKQDINYNQFHIAIDLKDKNARKYKLILTNSMAHRKLDANLIFFSENFENNHINPSNFQFKLARIEELKPPILEMLAKSRQNANTSLKARDVLQRAP